MTPQPEPIIEQRAGVIFDALVADTIAGGPGLTSNQLRHRLITSGVWNANGKTDSANRQVVTDAISKLRSMLASDGEQTDDEVVICNRAGRDSTYRIAVTPEQAKTYRKNRSRHIKAEIISLVKQVETERCRFGGSQIFTDAAIDYFQRGISELERAAAMDLAQSP